MKKTLALILVIIMAAGLLAGCNQTQDPVAPTDSSQPPAQGSASPSPSPSPGGSGSGDSGNSGEATGPSETEFLRLNWRSAIGTDTMLDCPWASQGEPFYQFMVFSRLMAFAPDGTLIPDLASSWTVSADHLTYTFTLVDNAVWHDGVPVTVDDVVFSLNGQLKVLNAVPNFKSYLINIVGAQDVADGVAASMSGVTASGNTVTIKLVSDVRMFLPNLSYIYILPKHLLDSVDPEELDKYEPFWSSPVGSGPYKINEMRFPDYFTVVRNDDYFGPKAGVKNVLFTSYYTGGDNAAVNAAIAGQLDVEFKAFNDIAVATNVVSQNSELEMELYDSGTYRMFMMNLGGSTDGKHNTDILKKEVRQAIGMIIDKQVIADFYAGQASPLTTTIPTSYPAFNTDIPLWRRDLAKAGQLLTEAGFDFSRPIRLAYYYDDQTSADVMEVFKQQFADAGITLETELLQGDLGALIYESRNFDICYAGGGIGGPIGGDPIYIAYSMLRPTGAITDNVYADVEQRTAIFTPLLDRYATEYDLIESKKLGDEIQLLANEHCYSIPIYGMKNIVVFNSSKVQKDGDWNLVNKDTTTKKFDTWSLLK